MDDDEQISPPPNPIYSFIKYSILSVCIIATSYRIYLNYQTYCEYKVMINSKVELTEEETLPQLSICFYEMINEAKLIAYNQTLYEEYHELVDDPSKTREWVINNFSLKKLFDLSFNFDDYFINCSFLDNDAIKSINCSDFYTTTLSTRKICFNFFHRKKEETREKWSYNRILLQNRPWVRIYVKKQFLKNKKKMDVIINPYFSIPNTDKSNPGFKSYSTDYTQSIFVSYDCRRSTRLAKPFETECLNYTKVGYFDRQNCIYECKVFNFLHEHGDWTEELTMNRSLATRVDKLKLTFNYTKDLKNDCEINEKKCKHLDCDSKEYTIVNKYHKLDVASITSEIELRLYLNSVPTNSLEYEALYPLGNSFVQMFIGPASLWLGLSIYSLSKLVFCFLCVTVNRKSRTKKNIDKSNDLDVNNNLNIKPTFNKFDHTNGHLDNESSKLSNPEKLNIYLNNYNTNYRPYVAGLSRFNPDVYNANANFDKLNNNSKEKFLNTAIDNYYNQLNKNLMSDLKFNNSSLMNQNYFIDQPINSISRMSPLIYKTSLEMYPKKPLKIKKTIIEEEEEANSLKDDESKKNNRQSINNNWWSKLRGQKDKLITYLFKRNQKIYPNQMN